MTSAEPTSKPTPSHASKTPAISADDDLNFARMILAQEADSLATCARTLDESFPRAVSLIVTCAASGGTVLVTGLGKSGLIGAKISATLASLGIPSHPVHPTEASHGDLGRFRPTDTVLCLSRSGETEELVNLAAILRQDNLPIIAITSGNPSEPSPTTSPPPSTATSLERLATVTLHLGEFPEAGNGVQAPTCSTTATLALGDALALAAARTRNFTDADFARRHPGGTLGGLLRPVTDLLRVRINESNPAIPDTTPILQAIAHTPTNTPTSTPTSTPPQSRRVGAIVLVNTQGKLTGIFTDADLRRKLIELGPGDWIHEPISTVMTHAPATLSQTALVRDAVLLFRQRRLDEIPIVDIHNAPVGILDVQDLIAMKLVKDTP